MLLFRELHEEQVTGKIDVGYVCGGYLWFVMGVSFCSRCAFSSGRCICVRIVHIQRILSFLHLHFSFAVCKTSFPRYGIAGIPH